jgi:hypothetical protein
MNTTAAAVDLVVWRRLLPAVHYLDFKGRVREVSMKNFQLVHWDHNRNQLGTDLVLLFGKKEHGEYALDFCYPMNLLQAFALGTWPLAERGAAAGFDLQHA